ncbi:hypothetical protein L596_002994 [Steinernema carpocapsae]|uniref:Uncharacterized protein n=1 Tax=Steinernema carpocapsae TaxID=34508 RepID=A0A4U8URT9_STECR|nr:hypothetical protein L596_002994 [Steinernema carpocapsae]
MVAEKIRNKNDEFRSIFLRFPLKSGRDSDRPSSQEFGWCRSRCRQGVFKLKFGLVAVVVAVAIAVAIAVVVAVAVAVAHAVVPKAINSAITETKSEKSSDNFAQRDAPVCKDFSRNGGLDPSWIRSGSASASEKSDPKNPIRFYPPSLDFSQL